MLKFVRSRCGTRAAFSYLAPCLTLLDETLKQFQAHELLRAFMIDRNVFSTNPCVASYLWVWLTESKIYIRSAVTAGELLDTILFAACSPRLAKLRRSILILESHS